MPRKDPIFLTFFTLLPKNIVNKTIFITLMLFCNCIFSDFAIKNHLNALIFPKIDQVSKENVIKTAKIAFLSPKTLKFSHFL